MDELHFLDAKDGFLIQVQLRFPALLLERRGIKRREGEISQAYEAVL